MLRDAELSPNRVQRTTLEAAHGGAMKAAHAAHTRRQQLVAVACKEQSDQQARSNRSRLKVTPLNQAVFLLIIERVDLVGSQGRWWKAPAFDPS